MATFNQYAYPVPAEAWYWTAPGGSALPLQSPYGAWNLTTFGGSRYSLPVMRGQNYAVPFKAGQSQRQKLPDSRTITATMWIDGQGDQAAGTYPASDQRLAFNDNYQALRQQFFQMTATGSAQGLLTRNWYVTQQGTPKLVVSATMAEIAGSMDLTMNGRTSAAFSADFLLADPFFYGNQQQVSCAGGSTSITGLGEGIAGLGWPSAVNTFTITISAACTITNITAGVSLTFTGAATYPVVIDVLNGTVTDSAAVNWIGGLSHAGARAWMVVQPGTNIISVSAGTAVFRFADCYL